VSIFGVFAYGIIVTHSIWSIGAPWWIALPISVAFFAFFFDHMLEQLVRNLARVRDGTALAIFSFGRWCTHVAVRLRAVSARSIAILGLKTISAGCAATLIVIIACNGIALEQPLVITQIDPPQKTEPAPVPPHIALPKPKIELPPLPRQR